MKPPGLTHWKPCLAFGLAQNKMARIRPMMTSSTGHFAISQTVTAVDPMPSMFPTLLGQGAGHHDDDGRGHEQDHRAAVTPSRTVAVFQIGRPSGTS